MRRKIRLNESQLIRIIKKAVNETVTTEWNEFIKGLKNLQIIDKTMPVDAAADEIREYIRTSGYPCLDAGEDIVDWMDNNDYDSRFFDPRIRDLAQYVDFVDVLCQGGWHEFDIFEYEIDDDIVFAVWRKNNGDNDNWEPCERPESYYDIDDDEIMFLGV